MGFLLTEKITFVQSTIETYSKFKILSLVFCCIWMMNYAQPKKGIVPRTYVAYKTAEPISIDGKDSEQDWQNAHWTTDFVDIQSDKKPKYNTRVKMLWGDKYFYVLAQLEEPHIWADITQHDAIVFHNNDFELFIDPDGDANSYYELEINALNTIWDLFIDKPYREANNIVLNDWEATGLKSAINIDGTLNNHRDKDRAWTLEIAIPWAVYKTSYFDKNVPENKFWRVNFSRVNWDFDILNGKYRRKKAENGKLLPEYNWVWSSMGVVNMHEPEKWGYVFFSSKSPGQRDIFTIPKDEKIKWKLFELYRNQKKYFDKNKTWASSLKSINGSEFFVNEVPIKPILENHSLGYNIWVKSPFTGKLLAITEDGKFISK